MRMVVAPNMCSKKIFLLLTSFFILPPNLRANNTTENTQEDPIQDGDINVEDAVSRNESPLETLARINKANLIALETFGELNQFWGNVNRIFLPLAERVELGLLSLLRVFFPHIFGDLNPSDIAIDKVTHPPDKSNSLIKKVFASLLDSRRN
ncbi:unnamed protein product [Litomosoides sigmodontis]|uniref:Uncharacterized protein n=1 Tax=Litomosoides sigmodontis TaxID=42156 RepID=A0A3P6UDC4_LITSI|nr:unnamed protein product [Litomosoides sigmodontis]